MRRPRPLLVALLLSLVGPFAASQVTPALYSGMRWRSIGPYRSGNVYAVAGIPGDPTTYYIGLPEGGVWKTTSGGTVWSPIFDQVGVPSIGSIAVARSRPSTVYVGTGDPTGWSFTPGKGVYRSDDAGKTWRALGPATVAYIPVTLVDPHDPQRVLIASQTRAFGGASSNSRGVFLSRDGGATWQHTLSADSVVDMAWDADDPAQVFAVTQSSGIYKSTDEGATWQSLAHAPGLPEFRGNTTIAVAPGTHGQRVYVVPNNLSGGRASGVYRSDDGGATWRLATTHVGSAGGALVVAPGNPDLIYLTGTALYRSTDGAATFTPIKGSPGGDDYRDLWVDPTNPDRIIAGVDQGPTISVDGGHTWTPWYNLPNGQFYNVFTDNQFPYQVYGAQQDSGTAAVLSRSDYGSITFRDWRPVSGFEFSGIAPDPLNPRWVYTQGWYDVLRRWDRETGQVAVVFNPTPADHWSNLPPTMFSPENPHRLYLASNFLRATDDGGKTWIHLGPDLTLRSQPPLATPARPRFVRPAAIASLAPSPLSANLLWAGTSNGLVQLSRDGGKSWSNVSPPQLTERSSVVSLDASHHDPGTAYAAVQTAGSSEPELLRTSDYGRTWQLIVAGLPTQFRTRTVREDPEDANLVFAGTEMGAWVSFDRGDHWQPLQLNLPHTVVSGLTVHGDDLVASTYGRGLWILDDITPLRQAAAAVANQGVYLFQPEIAMRVRWSNNHDTPLPPEFPAGQNPPEGAILDYYLPHPANGPVTLAIYDASGQLVNQYSNTPPPPDTSPANVADYWFYPPSVTATSAGMHRFVWHLRYPDPKALTYSYYGNMLDYTEYTLTWHAVKGHTPRAEPPGPLAIPGTYQVKLTVDGKTYTRTLTVKNDPRSLASASDLDAQLALEKRVMAGLAVSYDAYYQIQAALRNADPALKAKLEPLASGTAQSGFGVANRNLARNLQDLEFGDLRPTLSVVDAVNRSCSDISAAESALRAALPTAHLPSGDPCGR